MSTLLRTLVFALGLAAGLSPSPCPADVAPMLPHDVVISKMDAHGDFVFVIYRNGDIAKGVLLDPKEGRSGDVQLPSGLPVGALSLLAVPRALAEERDNAPDPDWLHKSPPGVIRVSGVIHHRHVEKHSMRHQYELDKTDDGLKVTLLNPDVLTGYGPEPWMLEKRSSKTYLWIALAGAAVLIAGVVAVWSLKRRG